MGESDRYHEYKKQKRSVFSFGDDRNSLMALFILNTIFFLVLMVLQVGYNYFEQTALYNNQVVQWFELPASLTKFSERPWTILTYMFSDTGSNIIRLISNMIWLWAFGYLLQQMAGNDKLIPIYIYGGLLGGILFMASSYFLPATSSNISAYWLLGANASTMAVAAAATTLSPDFRFFTQIGKGIPIWVLLAVYIIIDLAGLRGSAASYSIAHLGGALAGFLFVYFLRKGRDGSTWMIRSYNWFMHLFDPNKKGHSTSPRDTIFYKTGDRKPYDRKPNITQQRVDEILDKINQKGYHFLTDEEKDILKKAADDKNL